jgi:hypothetical protein
MEIEQRADGSDGFDLSAAEIKLTAASPTVIWGHFRAEQSSSTSTMFVGRKTCSFDVSSGVGKL